MTPPVESLNVAVATGIILYEARRQRNAMQSELFDDDEPRTVAMDLAAPLAERMRPRSFDEIRRAGRRARAWPAAPGSDRARPAAIDHSLGSARNRQDDDRAPDRRTHASALRRVQRRALRDQGHQGGHGKPMRSAAARIGARFFSSTRSTGSTRRSRTRFSPTSRPARSCSSARRPRIRRSR